MKQLLSVATLFVLLVACSSKKGPDVSNIKVEFKVVRFEQDFFALDTNNLEKGLKDLAQKYPLFLNDYLIQILGLPPVNDSSGQALMAIKQFISDYKPVKDSSDKIFASTKKIEEEFIEALKHLKYYFPTYQAPKEWLTYIGPMDAFVQSGMGTYSDIITKSGLATGLQLHLGANFSLYNSQMGLALYPNYISRKFNPETIVVNSMKNILDEIQPDNSKGFVLVEQMIEKGKRLYVLDQLMPDAADTLKIGYTSSQLKGCYENEGRIWNFFVTNNYLLNNEPGIVHNYMSDGPKTDEFGQGAPGYIGLFVGWQIVKKYMDDHKEMSLTDLLKLNPRKLFEDSKYRPK